MSSATFKTPTGGDPSEFILRVARDAQVTEGHVIYAAQRQRTRILERTLNGVDVDGNPFEPYSTNGPYYYYPNGRVGNKKTGMKANKAAAKRIITRIGVIESHTGKQINASLTKSSQGVKFESYAAFKAAIGRRGVDLMGPRAPHMLQAIAIGARFERRVGDDIALDLGDRPTPATEVVIGIYGDEAGRAEGHNTGVNPRWRRNHKRHFFGASESDLQEMQNDIASRIMARVDRNNLK
jgi:hypothetical protein